MITKEQFLEALRIIDAYHRQLLQESNPNKLTPIREWEKFNECSVRLQNSLIKINEGSSSGYGYMEHFIENIDARRMLRVRNCGPKVINEFIYLRGY